MMAKNARSKDKDAGKASAKDKASKGAKLSR